MLWGWSPSGNWGQGDDFTNALPTSTPLSYNSIHASQRPTDPQCPCSVLLKGPQRRIGWTFQILRLLFSLPSDFLSPFCPQGLDEPEGWDSQLARLNFAGWEFFRVLIKRSHPERMTSLVHTHALWPCPPLCPHSHAEPRQGRQVEEPSGEGMSVCVCQQAKCRLRAFLTFFPLVQCCHRCVSLTLSCPAEQGD